MTEPEHTWTEDTSTEYRRMANVAIPYRAEQLAMLLTLIPFPKNEKFHIVELASGNGELAQAILTIFPNATLFALDRSESMRQETSMRLRQFESRASVGAFDIAHTDWFSWMDNADIVISSLCIHHLDEREKQRLFHTAYERISKRGMVLIADLIMPQRIEAWRLYEQQWDHRSKAQSLEVTGALDAHHRFMNSGWNYFRHPDSIDKPSGLFDQLSWLKGSGFALVDCFWLFAGFAIFGAYKSTPDLPPQVITFEAALEMAHQVLEIK